jgi:hypothetical protein
MTKTFSNVEKAMAVHKKIALKQARRLENKAGECIEVCKKLLKANFPRTTEELSYFYGLMYRRD